MKIKYVGRMAQTILGDIADPRYNSWLQNEVKEVPDYDIEVVDAYGLGEQMNAIKAVFNHGLDLVDDATGKNPLFVCATCGGDAHSEFFKPADDIIEYATADGAKLCVACYLIANPQHVDYHSRQGHYGLPADVRKKIADAQKAAPIVAPAIAEPPAPLAVRDEENHDAY